MRKLMVGIGIVAGLTAASAFAQATSGGQAPQAGGDVRSSDVNNSNNPMEQYRQQRELNNLPGQQQTRPTAGKSDRARPAKADELTLGARVNDKTGVAIATILSIDPDGVVVSDGKSKVKVPADAFGHNKAGLLLDLSKAEFEQIVAKANGAS